MSDARAGTARRGAIAVAVAFLLVGSAVGMGLLVGGQAVANRVGNGGLNALAATLPEAIGKSPNSADRNPSASVDALRSALAAYNPSALALLSTVPVSEWLKVAQYTSNYLVDHPFYDLGAGLPNSASHGASPNAHLTPDGVGPNTIFAAGLVVGVSCVIAGALSLGLACLAVICGVALSAFILYLLGSDATTQIGQQVRSLAVLLIEDFQNAFSIQITSERNLIQALNLTVNALGYQAAAGALLQLPNSSYSPALDIVQSGIADELGAEAWANAQTIANNYGRLINIFDQMEGIQNGASQFCPLVIDGGYLSTGTVSGALAPGGGAATCPQNNPTSFAFPTGTVYPYEGFPMGTATGTTLSGAPIPVYLRPNASMSVVETSGSPTNLTATFVPISGGHWFNVSAGAVHGKINFTFAGPVGAYNLYDQTSGSFLYASWAFPLSATAEGSVDTIPVTPTIVTNGAGTNPEFGAGTAIALTTSPHIDNGAGSFDVGTCIFAGTPNGCPSPNDYAIHFVRYLYNLATTAQLVGQTYWTFLRNLGYTNVNQIPPGCVIPTPSQILPPGIPPQELLTMNLTTMLQLYMASLGALAHSFNATNALGVSNFCGKHVVFNSGAISMPFGVYGWGWVYVPSAKNWSGQNNSVAQRFSGTNAPYAWNLSGQIFLAPSIYPEKIALNQTWVLPAKNPTYIFVVPIVGQQVSGGTPRTNPDGPFDCLTPTGTDSATGDVGADSGGIVEGCNTTASLNGVSLVQFAIGNSTNNNGSAFPTNAGTTPGYAVYLTACFVSSPTTSNPNTTYHAQTGSCQFNVSQLNPNASGTPCDSQINPGCAPPNNCIFCPISGSGCGVNIWFYGTLVNDIATFAGGFTPLGCVVGELVGGIVVIFVAVVVVYVVLRIVRGE